MPNLCPPRSRLDLGRRRFPLTDVKQAAVSVPKENQYECGQEIFLIFSLFYEKELERTLKNIKTFPITLNIKRTLIDVKPLSMEMTIFKLVQHLAVSRSTSLHIIHEHELSYRCILVKNIQ